MPEADTQYSSSLQERRKALLGLMARVAQQDREAFAELYRQTSLKLFGIVLRILRNKSVAEDILQEVYVKIWQHAKEYSSSRGSPITWMAILARNRALDEVRRFSPLTASEELIGFEEIPAEGLNALGHLLKQESHQKLATCLEQIETSKRQMLLDAYFDGLSREALSQKFDQPLSTVKTWLRRSLLSLKLCIEQ